MSKLLRETVNIHGACANVDPSARDGDPRMLGPFYCGMSMVMNMPSFAIKLSSPTSTSKQISVATKFSGMSGILVEFWNFKGDASRVRGMDVSAISRFKEEDERYD